MCLSGASRARWPGSTLPNLVLHPAMLPRASALARQSLRVQSDTIQSVADNARANFILARAAIMTGRPEEAIDRLPEDDCHQQGSTAPRLVAHLPGPHARSRLQARRGFGRIQRSAGRPRRAQDTRLAAERGVKPLTRSGGTVATQMTIRDGSAPDKPGPDSRGQTSRGIGQAGAGATPAAAPPKPQ